MRDIRSWIGLTLLFIFFSNTGQGQFKELRGYVKDDHSDEPIPFASIGFTGSQIGRLSDSAGRFVFRFSKWPSDTLLVTYAGFEETRIFIDTTKQNIEIQIRLQRERKIEGVLVKSKLGRGVLLWRKIVRNKPRNDRRSFDRFGYELYNKMEVDLNNVNAEKMQKGILPPKPFKFILNNIDTASEEKPILPIYLIETLSDYYVEQNPHKTREIVKASKSIGLKNESVTKFLGGTYQNINVYKNFIPVFDKDFVSPISDDGDLFYNYRVPDTQYVSGKRVFHLVFQPKRKGTNTFYGDAWIVDSIFAVQKMNLQIGEGSNLNFIDKLSLVQEYQLVKDSIWFLSKDKFVANIRLTGPNTLSFIGRKTTTYTNIQINDDGPPPSMKREFVTDKRVEVIRVSDGAMDQPESYWIKNRHESLNKNENNFYKMADTLIKMPAFEQYSEWLKFIGTGYRLVGNYEIGPWMNWISGNIYEGLRLRFDLGTNYRFNKNIYLSSYLAYGTKDKKIKGKLEALFMLGKDPRSSIRLMYKNDMDYGQTYYDEIGYDNLFALTSRKTAVPIKLIKIEQQKVEYFKEWRTGLSLTANIQRKIYTPIQNLPFIKDFTAAENAGNFNDFQFNAKIRFAYLERFLQDDFFRTSLGSDYPVTEFYFSKGIKGLLNSGYSYTKMTFSISDYLKIPPLGNVYYNLYAGKVNGRLPYMLLNIAPGNEIYYYNKYAFNLMNRFEYIFDRYTGLNIEHNIGSGIFRLLPQNKIFKLRQFWNAKMMWGSISEQNQLLNIRQGFPFTSLNGKTYMELGTGIDNIFRFFRVDLVWRLAPKPLPMEGYKRFGVFGSFRFSF
ncbi:MAG: DUF5686 family protein [Chitinophagia bacterium]|jgi:hypothetical protein